MLSDVGTIRLAGIVYESIVDGPGVRMTIFTQGCPHHCAFCHNPSTHDFAGGVETEIDILENRMKERRKWLDGLTISGGEPFCQIKQCARIARTAHSMGLNVWCYTGFTFEELFGQMDAMELLKEIDILVDGPFENQLRTLELPFRGSKNQRLIDVGHSLECGKAIEYI